MFMVGRLLRFGSIVAWVLRIVACMGADAFNRLVICVLVLSGLALSTIIVLGKRQRIGLIELSLYWSSGCLGCAIKPKLMSSVDGPLKRQNPGAQEASRASTPNISERFWTSSICDMDNSTIPSQGSMSSVSTSTQLHDTHCTSSSSAPSEFVNHGLLLWKQTRQQWIGTKKPDNRPQQLREPRFSWNATYDSLLGSNKPFPKPIPLAEMVDFLVDVWEQEGMYD